MSDKQDKLTPLQQLAKRPMPIFDVVHGADNPSRQPVRKPTAEKPKDKLDGRSLVRDLIPASTLHALQTLHWRLERAEARRKKRKAVKA